MAYIEGYPGQIKRNSRGFVKVTASSNKAVCAQRGQWGARKVQKCWRYHNTHTQIQGMKISLRINLPCDLIWGAPALVGGAALYSTPNSKWSYTLGDSHTIPDVCRLANNEHFPWWNSILYFSIPTLAMSEYSVMLPVFLKEIVTRSTSLALMSELKQPAASAPKL